MKSLLKVVFGLFACMCVLAACKDDDDKAVSGFTLDLEEITVGAEGGTETVQISTGTKWVAKVDQPWIQVMPANGDGSTDCKIVIDTTLRNDIRQATVTFQPEGTTAKKLEIHQTGYGKMIGLSVEEVEVPSMAAYGKRFFDVSVTTNVDFNVQVATDAAKKDWLTVPKYSVDLNYGARPRTTKLRFEWAMNTLPEERLATVLFEPKNEEDQEAKNAALKVIQVAAPKIEDNRSGDSLALIIMAEKLRMMGAWDTSEKMEYWRGVTLWEKKDKEVKANPEMVGRVRSAAFAMINTKESIPDEVAKLKYLETLSISSNENTMLLYDLSVGTAICELEHLKNLSLFAYGFEILPKEFVKLGKTLESLDLSSNLFTEIPAVLTKENFPKLRHLYLGSMRRYSIVSNLQTETRKKPGLLINLTMSYDSKTKAFKELLKWDNLKTLKLSYNLISGTLPTMTEVPCYTDADIAANDTLKVAADILKKTPKVLPNTTSFSINLNYLSGPIPNWILYHPHLSDWNPFTLLFTQDTGYDMYGKLPGFTNEPASLDYYYDLFPLKKPTISE